MGVLLPRQDGSSIVNFPRTGVYVQPSTGPQFDTDIERQHFNTFQTRVAPELTGYFDSSVWNRKVLQICHDQAFARHAVVAIGALWRAMDLAQSLSHHYLYNIGGNQEAKELYKYALREYGKALQLMVDIPRQEESDRLSRC